MLLSFVLYKDEEDEYQPENVTFAPKDVMPVDLTPKENVHGLGYKGLDPSQALFGASGREHLNLFTGSSEDTSNLLGDLRHSKGRKLGITGQVRTFLSALRCQHTKISIIFYFHGRHLLIVGLLQEI